MKMLFLIKSVWNSINPSRNEILLHKDDESNIELYNTEYLASVEIMNENIIRMKELIGMSIAKGNELRLLYISFEVFGLDEKCFQVLRTKQEDEDVEILNNIELLLKNNPYLLSVKYIHKFASEELECLRDILEAKLSSPYYSP